MSHTKGPWRSFEAGSEGARILPDTGNMREDNKLIAIVNGRDTLTDFDNARLIAAAPELLKALTALRTFIWAEGYGDQTATLAQANAAIAKATGGTQ